MLRNIPAESPERRSRLVLQRYCCSIAHNSLRLTFNLSEAFVQLRGCQQFSCCIVFRLEGRIDGLCGDCDSTTPISFPFLPWLFLLFLPSLISQTAQVTKLGLSLLFASSQVVPNEPEMQQFRGEKPFQRVWPGHRAKYEPITLTRRSGRAVLHVFLSPI